MYRQRFHSLLLCLIVVAMCSHLASSAAQAEKQLRWKLKKGDAFDVVMQQDINQKMNVQGNDVDITQKMQMFVSWTVDDIDAESIISMSQTIDRIVMDMKGPGIGDVKIDTDSKEAVEGAGPQMIMSMIKPMVKVKMVQKMNDRGEVLDVVIPEEALAGLKQNPIMQQFFSGDAFKEMMRKASPSLPEEAINPGFEWNRDSKVKSPIGDMQMSNKFKYEGEVEKDGKTLDKISANVEMQFEGGNNQLGANITVTEQDNQGIMYFDAKAGRFVESELDQKMTMKVEVAGQSINQKIVNKTTMKITPKTGG